MLNSAILDALFALFWQSNANVDFDFPQSRILSQSSELTSKSCELLWQNCELWLSH